MQVWLFIFLTLLSIPAWRQIKLDFSQSPPLRLATYNLRYDSRPDNITVQQSLESLPDPLVGPGYYRKAGEQPWSIRRPWVAEQLLHEGVVLVGFQEALVRQVRDLAELLGPDLLADSLIYYSEYCGVVVF
ncbi:hypothetical protein FB45DRAFT_1020212 [Roridomyces roridus]|uniref:Endonuclease/exonuclease/phosphatase domain-containing protein n=1 Tax=Roridomyces roridus TaxID=1738132 RepID=A0AAD7CGF8_9AGAR|nr:hypothetical protein FB45DRAFT_1020212 [Roridomyces roridus]